MGQVVADQRLVIFTAVEMEARAVARGLGLAVRRGGVMLGSMEGYPIEVRAIGIRAVRIPGELPPGTGCVILAGFGGALDPALKVGDAVLDWPEVAMGPAPDGSFKRGRIRPSNRIVATPEQKAALFGETGAIAVEMEGAAVRTLVGGTGVPLIGLRAVTDTAGETLDPALLSLVDEVGRPKPLAVAAFLARRPARIASLHRLGAAARLAGRRLGEAVGSLVRSSEFKRLMERQ